MQGRKLLWLVSCRSGTYGEMMYISGNDIPVCLASNFGRMLRLKEDVQQDKEIKIQ